MKNREFRNQFYFFLAAGILIRLVTVFAIPIFYAPDEESHFNYIYYLYLHGELPVAYAQTGAKTQDWEYHQPPLYYLLNSFLLSSNFKLSFYLCRLASVASFAGTLYFGAKIVQSVNCSTFFSGLFLSLFSFLPTYVFISSSINNDNLIILLSTLIVYYTITIKQKSIKSWILVACWISLAFYTKFTAFVPALFCGFMLILTYFKERKMIALINVTVITITAFVLTLPLFLRNLELYGHVLGPAQIHEQNAPVRTMLGSSLLFSADYLIWSFYAVAGIVNDLRPQNWFFGYLLLLLILFGIIFHSKKKNPALFAGCIAVFANLLFILWFGIKYDQAQGRFLLVSLPIVSYFYASGLAKISFMKPKIKTSFIIISACLLLLSGWFLTILKLKKCKNSDRLQPYTTHFKKYEQKKSPEKPEK